MYNYNIYSIIISHRIKLLERKLRLLFLPRILFCFFCSIICRVYLHRCWLFVSFSAIYFDGKLPVSTIGRGSVGSIVVIGPALPIGIKALEIETYALEDFLLFNRHGREVVTTSITLAVGPFVERIVGAGSQMAVPGFEEAKLVKLPIPFRI